MKNNPELGLVVYEAEPDWSEETIRVLEKTLNERALNFCQKNRFSYATYKDEVTKLIGAVLVRGNVEVIEGEGFEKMVLAKLQDGMYQRQRIINLGREYIKDKKADFRIFEDLGISATEVRLVEIELEDNLVAWPVKTEKLMLEMEERKEALKKVENLMFPDGFIGADGRKRELLAYQQAVFTRGLILKCTLEQALVKDEVDPLFFDERSLKIIFDSYRELGVSKINRLMKKAAALISDRLMVDDGRLFEDLGNQGWGRIGSCQNFTKGFETDPVKWHKIKSILSGWLPIDPIRVGDKFGLGTDKSTIWRHPELIKGVSVAGEVDLISALWVTKQDGIGIRKNENKISHGLSLWKEYKSESKLTPRRIVDLESRLAIVCGEIGEREDPNDFKFFTVRIEKAKAYAAERSLRFYDRVLASERKLIKESSVRSMLLYSRDQLESEYSQLYQSVVSDGVRKNVTFRVETLEEMKRLRNKIRVIRGLIDSGKTPDEGSMIPFSLVAATVLPSEMRDWRVLKENEKFLIKAEELISAYRKTGGGFYFELVKKSQFESLMTRLRKEPKFKGPLAITGKATKAGRLEYFLERLKENMDNQFLPWEACVGWKLSVLMELTKQRINIACAILYYPDQLLELQKARGGVVEARSKRDLVELYEKKEAIEFDLGLARKRFASLDNNFIEEMTKLGFTMKS